MRSLLSSAVEPLQSLRVVAMHLALNAALMAAASYWLLIPEAHIWQLACSVVSALLIVSIFLWLHSGTLVYAANQDLRDAFAIKLNRWISLFLGLVILLWLMHRADIIAASRWQIGGYLYSKSPVWLRPSKGSAGYVHAVDFFFSLVIWYFLPGLILPIAAARVLGSELRTAFRAIRSWRFWLALAFTALLGIWLVKYLLAWIPGTTLHEQSIGLAARLGLVYLLGTAAWLLTAGLLAHFVSTNK